MNALLASVYLGAVGFSSQLVSLPLVRLASKRGFSLERFLKARTLMKTKKQTYHQCVGYNDLILKRVALREYQSANADYYKSTGFYLLPFIVAVGLGAFGYSQIKRFVLIPQERRIVSVDLALAGGLGLSVAAICKKAGVRIWSGPAFAPFVIGLGLSGMGSSMFMKPDAKIYLLGSVVGFSLLQIL